MRKIKFRMWDTINKKYIGVIDLSYKKFVIAIPKEIEVRYEQFIGLRDRTGVEIYEGDMLQDTYYHKPLQVQFINGGFWIKRDNGDITMPSAEFRKIVRRKK